jgi:hypothetical protein
MKNPHLIIKNCRDRYSDLPIGEFDLKEGEIVDLLPTKEANIVTVRKEDGYEIDIYGSYRLYIQKQS